MRISDWSSDVCSSDLFLFIALGAATMLAFGLWRLATSDPVPGAAQQDFQILPRTPPVAALLDPAGPDSPASSESTPPTGVPWKSPYRSPPRGSSPLFQTRPPRPPQCDPPPPAPR